MARAVQVTSTFQIIEGVEDPLSVSISGPVGSLFIQTDTRQVYRKHGAGGNDWTPIDNMVVFAPGKASPLANEFTTWAAAHAAASAIPGVTRLVVDDAATSPAVIPAGAYDMEGIILSGGMEGLLVPITQLQVADGASFTNLRRIDGPIQIDSRATTTPVTAPASFSTIVLRGWINITVTTGGAPFFGVGTGSTYEIYMQDAAALVNSAGLEVLGMSGTGTCNLFIRGERSILNTDTITGLSGTVNATVESGNTANVGRTQTNFSGTLNATEYLSQPLWGRQGDSGSPVTANETGQVWTRIYYDPTAGTFQLDAPALKQIGDRWGVKNVSADVTGITISGNGSNIEDPTASYALAGSFSLVGDGIGAEWEWDGNAWIVP